MSQPQITNSQINLSGIQVESQILDNITAVTGNGNIVKTGSNTVATRSLTAPSAGFTITNNDGISGNPTFVLANDLAAIEGLSTNGIITRTTTDTWTTRTITGTTNQISITNGDGISGNPNIAISSNPILSGTGSLTVPVGTSAQRPGSPSVGMIRYNTTLTRMEHYDADNNDWTRLGSTKQWITGSIGQLSGTTTITYGNTAPTITDGTELWSQAITPEDVNGTIIITCDMFVDSGTNNRGIIATLFRDSTLVTVQPTWIAQSNNPQSIVVYLADKPNTTSSVTYSLRIGITSAATWYVNQGASATFGGSITTSCSLIEIS